MPDNREGELKTRQIKRTGEKIERHYKSSLRLKGTLFQPALDLRNSIVAPEKFAVDDDCRSAKDPELDGVIDERPQPILDFRLLHACRKCVRIDAHFACNLGDDGCVGDIAVIDEKGAVHRVNEWRDQRGLMLLQPYNRALRRHASNRESAWPLIRHAGKARRSFEVALCVISLRPIL